MFKDEILNSFKNIFKKYDCYLVGGYLRNYFLNNETSFDRDIVCLKNAKALALELAEFSDGTFIELDNENEIYRVVLKDKTNYFDISKCLEDDILKDIQRRDFTINSIFYDLNEEKIIDPLNGIKDIENKIIRTYNLQNLIDDPLRMLRLYRFYSKLGFEIEDELLNFTKTNFELIKNVALERINQEILLLFEGEFLAKTLLKMYDDGVLETIFPFVKEIKKIPKNSHHHLDLIHHSIETVKNIRTNNPLLKLSAFYHDIGKPSTWSIEPSGRHRFIGHDIAGSEIAQKELKDLKFSKKQISYITKMIKYHIYPATLANCPDNKKAFARFVRKLGKDSLDIIELSRADRLSAQGEDITPEIVENALNHLENLKNYYLEVESLALEPKPLLDGKEIMEILNIKPSKLVGEMLESIKLAQLSGELQTKEQAIEFIKKQK
ncbi:MAG: CCA tRNA nucleotidyltransferase [Candidatus Gastranaerophilales bacterium]|nr:CCA tRNA nucleotidyltransferase [Candidatus Gastranaerophilales bacterium]